MTTRINGRFRDDLATVAISVGIVLAIFVLAPTVGGWIAERLING